jgi:membrane associated rhomboid family serine protease
MDDADVFLARVVQLAGPGTRIDRLDSELALLRPSDTRGLLVARHRPEHEAEVLEQLGKILKAAGPIAFEALVVGGPDTLRPALRKLRRVGQHVYHQADDGSLWSSSKGPSFGDLLEPPPPVDAAALRALEAKAREGQALVEAERAELESFVGRQRAGRPWLTWSLLAIIAALFAVELAYDTTSPTLYHMGALHPPSVRDGEIWRLASCTFLHGGGVHVFMNGLVLLMLGSFLENVLGRWRLMLLYAAAAFGGSLVSFLTLKQGFSVGASGALWGCLGAHAVLAFRPAGLLPRAMIPGAQRAALTNLVGNVFISFLPHVDWAAHAGGGVVGAALLYFVLRRGLPRLDDAREARVDRRPPYVAPLAALSMALLLGGLVVALARGRIWELDRPPVYEVRRVPEVAADFPVPVLLGPRDAGPNEWQVGRMDGGAMLDPALLGVARLPTRELDDGAVDAARAEIRQGIAQAHAGATALVEPEDTVVAGRPGVVARYRGPNGIVTDMVFVFFPGATYRVQTARAPAHESWADLAITVAEGLRPHGS